MNGIEIKNITKTYGSVTALDNVSVELEKGRIYGLLGRNGAGKSTLLNVITNRIFPDSGMVLIDGTPARENDAAQKQVYLMSEKSLYPDNIRVLDVFKWTGEFYDNFNMEYAYALCDSFQLNPKKKLRSLSTGYSSIYKMIVALSVDVPYILLDEPVLGLDANHRELFYKTLLASYVDKPRTIVISTHLIEEVSRLIEEILIIKDGKIIRQESCEKLLAEGYTATGPAAALDSYLLDKNVIGTDTLGGLKTAYILGELNRTTLPDSIEITKLDLQKLFIELTKS